MQSLRYFIDTHDRAAGTFPAQLTPAQFETFFRQYETACRAEGVIPLKIHLGSDDGRAFCFNLAPDAEAVRRAHERVGLPLGTITEVTTLTPADTFYRHPVHAPA